MQAEPTVKRTQSPVSNRCSLATSFSIFALSARCSSESSWSSFSSQLTLVLVPSEILAMLVKCRTSQIGGNVPGNPTTQPAILSPAHIDGASSVHNDTSPPDTALDKGVSPLLMRTTGVCKGCTLKDLRVMLLPHCCLSSASHMCPGRISTTSPIRTVPRASEPPMRPPSNSVDAPVPGLLPGKDLKACIRGSALRVASGRSGSDASHMTTASSPFCCSAAIGKNGAFSATVPFNLIWAAEACSSKSAAASSAFD
mmetsp:Transcript_54801/g.96051  ORF Transcript_54801/g.96051 Transcript_54801/m.96051 type:complete len:255 (-) Transcript_54801:4019-4783(-)